MCYVEHIRESLDTTFEKCRKYKTNMDLYDSSEFNMILEIAESFGVYTDKDINELYVAIYLAMYDQKKSLTGYSAIYPELCFFVFYKEKFL